MKERHGAKIVIPIKFLLEWLQFKGGVLHSIRLNEPYLPITDVEMVIEHPDLPPVKLGDELQTIVPAYELKCSKSGNVIEINRVDPPKTT